MVRPKWSNDVRFWLFQSNDVRFRHFESNDVRFRLCSTLPDIVRLCSTLLDFVRLYWTLFDFVRPYRTLFVYVWFCSTLSGISRRVLNYNDTTTRKSLDRFCQIIFQKSQPGQPQNIIENATKLSIVDLCSPSWVVGLTFQWNRPKTAMFWRVRFKMAMFWPTRPNFATFWPTWLTKKWLLLYFL